MSCLQRTQTVVVRVAEAVGGDGFKIYAVLGHIQVEAALCLAQVVEQADCAGNVAHRDILEHELVGEFDGFGQRAGVAGAVRISFLQSLHQGFEVLPLALPCFRRLPEQVAVDELSHDLQQTAGVKGADIQFAVVHLHPPDVLVLVAAKAGLQARKAAVREHAGGVAHHQLHILVFVHTVQADRLVQICIDEAAVQTAAELAVCLFAGLGEEDAFQSDLLVVILTDVEIIVEHSQVGRAGAGALRVDAKGVAGTVLFLIARHRGPGKGTVGTRQRRRRS